MKKNRKIAATVLGLMLAFGVAMPASAQSVDAQIAALLAQIAALQAQLQGGTSVPAGALFTSDMTIGSSGAEVTRLQQFLIGKGYAIPAIQSGVASYGYFGVQTQSAVASFQAANGIAPAAGYFGPITRARVNAMIGAGVPGTPGTPGTPDDDDDELGGGEASLEDLNASSGEDNDVEEGGTAEVAEFEFDVEDGDIRIERLDLTFEPSGTNDEDEPWETFDTITILNEDGDELASEDVSDEDDWLDEDEPYVFRFTGLDYVVREGDQGMLIVEVEAQNGIDGADDGETWTIYIDEDGLRGIDGEGLDQYLGDDSETVTFDVEEEGEGDELNISSSPDDPDASTLQVESSKRSDWYTIFAFELDAEDADVELDSIGVNLMTDDDDIRDVVNDAMLVIDGEEFDDFDWMGSTTVFDIDGDYTIDDGDTVTVEFMVEFKALTGNYAEGTEITASTTGSLIEGEGADDLTADGSATGETHTLQTTGLNVVRTDRSAQTTTVDGSDNDYATFRIEVDVTAFEEDIFIPQTAVDAFTFQLENASNGNVVSDATATTSAISSTANTSGNYYRVNEGDTETFTFTVTYNPLSSDEGQTYRLQLLTIEWNDTQAAPDSTWTASPQSSFETQATYIND